MRTGLKPALWFSCALALLIGGSLAARGDDAEWRSIFDGKSLTGWDGNPDFWSVADGAIVGQTTAEKPTKGNTFLIWRGGDVGDFDLKVEYKIEAGNSGVQYRSFELPDKRWVVGGYQGDIDATRMHAGANYGEKFRGMLASRGQKTVIEAGGKPRVVGSVGDPAELKNDIKDNDWNEYSISARGFHFVQKINGHVMSEVTDDDTAQRRATGILALQLHQGPPMKVQFRNLRLKQYPSTSGASAPRAERSGKTKKIVFIAGTKSHAFGAHEHRAGSMLLAKALDESGLPVRTVVVTGGWPQDSSVLNDADAIVIYADGGAKHPFNEHIDELNKLAHKGVGIVCLHYAVEVPKGKSGDAFLDWTGGYFEADWSVNPHWTADYRKFPAHPISRGVKPFSINDEWYYHMRFRAGMEGVTPILTALPPQSTLSRPDGAHSGNPAVREAVKNGEPQYMAWARERPDGGRGFGFTGGHDHWNWGDNNFRKLVLNAIVWCAGLDVPSDGVSSKAPTVDDLLKNMDDKPVPKNFNPAAIQKMLDTWNGSQASASLR